MERRGLAHGFFVDRDVIVKRECCRRAVESLSCPQTVESALAASTTAMKIVHRRLFA
jgi:hypothetical protein